MRMTAGEFEEGSRVLRAKIDMTSPNMHMRDPIIYRIIKAHHHRTGDKWCIYPMYDFAHGQSDYWEGITHSVCTLSLKCTARSTTGLLTSFRKLTTDPAKLNSHGLT